MTKEALKLALEALEANQPVNYCMNSNGERFPMMHEDPFRFERNTKAITAIKEALAQRTWVGLTDGEIEVIEALKAPPVHPDFIDCDDWMDFARAIEYKLKEKNELR